MGNAQFGWLLLLAAVACSEAASVSTEVVPLAEGEYYAPSWGGTQIERFFAVARPGVPSDRTAAAVLVSPEHETPCSLGDDIASYVALQPRSVAKYVLGSPSPTRVLLFRQLDMDGFGTLSFADIDCKRMDFEVSGVSPSGSEHWTLYDASLAKTTLAFRTREDALIFVDPWAQEQREVARDVSLVWDYDQGMWLIESGQLVRRDNAGRELLRRGRGVKELMPLGDERDYAYVDAQGAFVVRGDKAKRIGPADACRLTQYEAFMPQSIGYFSPCAENHLVIVREDGTQRVEYEQHIDGGVTQVNDMLFFTTSDADTTTLFRVRASNPSKPEEIETRERFNVAGLFPLRPGVMLLYTREADNSYSLSALDLGASPPTRALLYQGIVRAQFSDTAVSLAYANGDLIVYQRDLGKELLRLPGQATAPNRFVFRGKAGALAYLSQYDPDTRLGRLELQFLPGAHFVLDDRVREFGEVWWPERGLIYTRSGERAGLNFARVDIPCETTSDTAWACGF